MSQVLFQALRTLDKGIGRQKHEMNIISYGVRLRVYYLGLPASERSSHVNKPLLSGVTSVSMGGMCELAWEDTREAIDSAHGSNFNPLWA